MYSAAAAERRPDPYAALDESEGFVDKARSAGMPVIAGGFGFIQRPTGRAV
jgi:hypothetical protein